MTYRQQKQLGLTALITNMDFPRRRVVFEPIMHEGKLEVEVWQEVLEKDADFWERVSNAPYMITDNMNCWCIKEALGKRKQVPRKRQNKWNQVFKGGYF